MLSIEVYVRPFSASDIKYKFKELVEIGNFLFSAKKTFAELEYLIKVLKL